MAGRWGRRRIEHWRCSLAVAHLLACSGPESVSVANRSSPIQGGELLSDGSFQMVVWVGDTCSGVVVHPRVVVFAVQPGPEEASIEPIPERWPCSG
jgi:hypothetical protein